VSTHPLGVIGNDAHPAAFTSNAGLCEDREREEVPSLAAAMYRTTPHRLEPRTKRREAGRFASTLVPTDTGVLGSGDQFPPTCSTVGLILSAMRLSRSWEEELWHAS
jgi:hypothetical protein